MPLYEYRCESCAHTFEVLVRGNTDLKCPSCAGTELERQLSVFAVGAQPFKASSANAAAAPCGSCGHPDGPGSCSVH
jgi:putative FmdB family regulatory protein